MRDIDVRYSDGLSLAEFVEVNRDEFMDQLLSNRSDLATTLQSIKERSGIDLAANAMRLVELTLNNRSPELIDFAGREGRLWAEHALEVSFKLEWIETVKTVLWEFIYNYYRLQTNPPNMLALFQTERNINSLLDSFLTNFSIRYNQFKDELLRVQRELVEDLSVPIIPLTSTVSVLPLIGSIDTFRANTVQEKVLREISSKTIETMIVDLSGVTVLDTAILSHLFHLFDGMGLMGCKVIVTGVRAEIANVLVKTGISLGEKVTKRGNVQQALEMLQLT